MPQPESQTRSKVLIQLDVDPQPSVFDAVVAVDAGADVLLRHASVRPEHARELVYGAIFTRAVQDLHNTAIFVGGSDVAQAEAVLHEVCQTFFGPMRVSVMLDANGANTTAAAAVLAAGRHVPLNETTALVLGATGPVGQRVAHLLASQGARIRVASRSPDRAQAVCDKIAARFPTAQLSACVTRSEEQVRAAAEDAGVVIAAGAPGVQLMTAESRTQCRDLKVAIDLNAVPPVGLEGIAPNDRAALHGDLVVYGALGVGGTKMKIHKAALRQLFASNDQVLDVDEIYQLGRGL